MDFDSPRCPDREMTSYEFEERMKRNKIFFISTKLFNQPAQVLTAILLVAVFLTSCAPPLVQSNPTPQPVLQSTPTVIDDQTSVVTAAAKSALAEQLKIGTDAIQLVDIESVQWPEAAWACNRPGSCVPCTW